MVSIRKSISDLERIYELQSASLECYRSAIQAVAQYAIEFDAEITASYRNDLAALSRGLRGEVEAPELLSTRSALREELRDYHDKAAAFLDGLREDLSRKSHALCQIADAMATADGDHEERLRYSLKRLRELCGAPEATPVRAALLAISEQFAEGIEQMKKQNAVMIGQFRVEIQMLHSQVKSLQSASSKDVFTHLSSRLEMETRISAEMEAGTSFSLLLLKVRNLPLIERQFGRQVRIDAMAAFVERVSQGLPRNAVIGRWNEDQFIGLLPLDKSETVALAKRLTQYSPDSNTAAEDSRPRTPALQFNTAVLVNSTGDTYESLIRKIDNYL